MRTGGHLPGSAGNAVIRLAEMQNSVIKTKNRIIETTPRIVEMINWMTDM
jgi:hypothetical protein